MEPESQIGYRIVTAIAHEECTDPLELDPPLHDAVDVDALEALFAHDGSPVEVRFEYREYQVRVRGPNDVEVAPNPAVSGGDSEDCSDRGGLGLSVGGSR